VNSAHVIVADVAFADRLDEAKRYFRSVTHFSQPWAAGDFYRKLPTST
jgi:hypothetical protein